VTPSPALLLKRHWKNPALIQTTEKSALPDLFLALPLWGDPGLVI